LLPLLLLLLIFFGFLGSKGIEGRLIGPFLGGLLRRNTRFFQGICGLKGRLDRLTWVSLAVLDDRSSLLLLVFL
jgi:hypothetical protein